MYREELETGKKKDKQPMVENVSSHYKLCDPNSTKKPKRIELKSLP